jgi:uncharacterized protein (TIGR02145 family)
MKNTLLFLTLFWFNLSPGIFAQAPQAFKYQAVARDLNGNPVMNQNVSVKIVILAGSTSGTMVYSELHSTATNSLGLFNLEIGNPIQVLSGSFAAIDWGAATHFLKLEIDPSGGSNFQLMGISQLLSVPYALFAENTANNDDADADPSNELQTIIKDGQTVTLSDGGGSFTDETNDADSNPTNELQTLNQNGLNVTLSQGGGTINVADNDNNPANELQQISKVGNTVTLSQNGGSFTDENTTYQAGAGLQLTGTTFSNLAPDQTVTINAGNGISKSGTYPGFTITNTLPDQIVTIEGTGAASVTGTYPNFIIHTNAADSSATDELQTLAQNGNEVTLSKGGGVISVADDDSDPANELQTVTETDYQVSLSQGGGSFMTGVKSYTQAEIDALTTYNGLTVHNSTTNCINYYFLNNWFEACGTCTPPPSQAFAGNDTIVTGGATSVNLSANTPEKGVGSWIVLSGEGGGFDDASNPNALFTGLLETTYVLRWSISNSCGTRSDDVAIGFYTFTCGSTITDERDGQTYSTVQIGTQCWMAQNLNTGTLISGTSNPANNGAIEKYCYSDNAANCDVYGGLYQWDEMMGYTNTPGVQGICPTGWHLPANVEWTALTTYLGGESVAGGKMKETGTTHWFTPNTDATNSSAFAALPGGNRTTNGSFDYLTGYGIFWSSTPLDENSAWYLYLYYNSASAPLVHYDKTIGYSVRCIRDESPQSNQAPSIPFDPQPADGATDNVINPSLSWSCTDPENDPLTFDVYFGTENPPAMVATAQTEVTFGPGLLAHSTAYYWKIVSHDNHSNSAESPVWTFTTITEPIWQCGNTIVDARDNQTYSTVQIGTQCWLAQNLNIGTRIDGTSNAANNGAIEKYCYSNNAANCNVYGGLYQWDEMMGYTNTPGVQGICPPTGGWHLPTNAQWTALTTYLGGESVAGGKMKETGTDRWFTPNTDATNSSGFTALPGGNRTTNGSFDYLTGYGIFWSSTPLDENSAWYLYLYYMSASAPLVHYDKTIGYSVRCIRDESPQSNQAPSIPFDPQPADGAIDNVINPSLSWSCTDPENDPLTFDVYFGTQNPPAMVATAQTEVTFSPGLLAYSTAYNWKIVAHDNHGNSAESPVWTFTTITEPIWQCGNTIVDARDNQTYSTVQIGTQCWMSQNLNIGNQIAGTSNPANNGTIEKYCYEDNAANCDVYGGLYQWNEMMEYSTTEGIQGICPPTGGWHLPTDAEWTALTTFLGGESVAGGKMKETGTTHWFSPNTGATNSSGFTALPGGSRYAGAFYFFGNFGMFWGSTQTTSSTALGWVLDYNIARLGSDNFTKAYGFSVRCLRDESPQSNLSPSIPFDPQPADGALDIAINSALSWSCTDPENNPLTFDVYFGTENPPAMVATAQTEVTFSPGLLAYSASYYWKIVAHDNHGNTSESTVWTFTTVTEPIWQCGNTIVDERDGQTYSTIQIGTQCWTSQNLNIGNQIAGTNNPANNGTIEKYCFSNNAANCDVYGGLYQWNEMMNYTATPGVQGICPINWHLPTDAEWTILTTSLGFESVAGGKMKETGTTHWNSPNTSATNSSGFTGLPGGDRFDDGAFYVIGFNGYFWSSTEYSPINSPVNAWNRGLFYNTALISRTNNTKTYGFSVRCLKD